MGLGGFGGFFSTYFGWVWLGLGEFGWVWVGLGGFWVGLGGFGWVWMGLGGFGWVLGLVWPVLKYVFFQFL